MRVSIGTRIFLALTTVSLVVVALSAVTTRYNFNQGFLEYVADQEVAVIDVTASSLADVYREDGGWHGLRDNPRRWNDVLRDSGRQSAPQRHAPPSGAPGDHPGRPGRPPPGDPLDLGRRLALLDADGSAIVGFDLEAAHERRVPVTVDATTVGYIGIAPRRQLTDRLDQEFARKQGRSIYLIAAAALFVAALFSAFLARHLTLPVRSLMSGARSISSGDYDTRIPDARNDELGDLAREFNRLAQTLDENRRSRRRWVSDIAHELRTPLSVLRGELDAIEDGVRPFDATSRESLQVETARLATLVDELHELTVYEEGGQNFRLGAVDVMALLRDTVSGAEQRLAEAGIDTVLQDAGGPAIANADESKLERVLLNLFENTLRYTDAPGRLVVSCDTTPEHVVVDFSDTAPGVPHDALPRLFDRLYRGDDSRSRATGGAGLGLAICKSIVEGHGGRIEARASDLGGLSIRLLLPVLPLPEEAP